MKTLTLRAFNLVPGCVIEDPNGDRWVVTEVDRFPDSETLDIDLRAFGDPRGFDGLMRELHGTIRMGYSDTVELAGIALNPDDPGDTDAGVEL